MKKDLDRREFFKIGGAVTAGAAVGLSLPLLPIYESYASGPVDDADLAEIRWGMVIDVTKCPADCTACMDACRQENNVAFHDDPAFDIHWIRKATVRRRQKGAKAVSVPLLCNHCDNPPCALVCPVQATYKREDGIVIVDKHRCIGCRYCLIACPYNMRMFNFKENHNPTNKKFPARAHGVSESCHFCYHRLGVGEQPACVEACSQAGHGALVFGNLNDSSSEAAQLVANNIVRALREDLGTKPCVFYIGL
jgi:molybdopterin-containing oxidoreductase family iron-sulfur binding subunit